MSFSQASKQAVLKLSAATSRRFIHPPGERPGRPDARQEDGGFRRLPPGTTRSIGSQSAPRKNNNAITNAENRRAQAVHVPSDH